MQVHSSPPPPQSAAFQPWRFALQLLRGRWFMMSASFLIMSGAGATYLFGVYSPVIKSTLGYDQSTLNLLGSIKDLGASIGVVSGLIAEVSPPWLVLLIGAAMNFAGYFMIWRAVTGSIPKPKLWQMCAFIGIGANSQNFANTGSLVTCVKNFPENRGMLLGLMKGFVGLSGAVFTQIYLAIYGNDAKSLILLIGWLPTVMSAIFVFNIRVVRVSRHVNEVVLHQFLGISLVLALALMGVTIAQKYVAFSHSGYVASTAVVCFLLFLPFFIAVREEWGAWNAGNEQKSPPVRDPDPALEALEGFGGRKLEKDEKRGDGPKWWSDVWSKPKRGEDYTILQALLSIDMLILFVTSFCGLGCSLAAVDNLGQIGESLGYPTHTISTFVSLVSIWNYFGRVFSGFVSEKLLLKWKVPRPLMMTLSLLLSALGDALVAYPFPGSVYIASLLIGFSYGVQLTLLFIIILELFGLKYYSTLFNCGQLSSPLGSYVLNVRVVGKLYDREALRQLARRGLDRSMVHELTCVGAQCYKLSFAILAGVNVVGALVSMILVVRTREYYKTDIYKRFRDEIEANERGKKIVV